MAGTQRVQVYLEKHKIGMLFEELMGKVIADQPEEPVHYLIRALERRGGRQGQVLRRSTDGDKMSVPKTGYDKPWQSNSKKMKGRDSSAERAGRKSTQSKAEWNTSTKTEIESFDELWDTREGGRSRGQRSASPSRKPAGGVSWGDGEDDLYSSHGYSGPHRQLESDSLAGEFSVAKETTTAAQSQKLTVVPKGRNQQRDSEKHRQELQKLVLNTKAAEDSGIEDDRDRLGDEEAVELMESSDALRSEGVTNIKNAGGVSLRTTSRQTGSEEPAVRVSICARCARVMTGEASEAVSRSRQGYGQLDDSDTELDRNYPPSRPQSGVRFSPDTAPGSDEEFESVSQVTGPRRPVWQDDSDAESVTPRKGKHMFASSTVPSKGRHMYSPTEQRSLKQTAVKVAQSTNFEQSSATRGASELRGHGGFNKTWSPEHDLSEKPATTEDDQTTRTTHSLTTGGGGWKVPNYEGDEASSFYGSPGNKGRKDLSGPY